MPEVWDKSLEPLIKLLIHKKSLPQRQAAEVGKKVVTIFRGKDFLVFLTNPANFHNLARRCPDALARVKAADSAVSPDQAKMLGDELINHGFVARAVAKVLKVDPSKLNEENSPTEAKAAAQKRKKWPEKIIRLPLTEQEFEPASFYV